MNRLVLIPAALALAAMVQDGPIAMQSGQWEFTTAITEHDMPGSPPEMVRAARSGLGPPRTESRCVSPAEAANPAARLAAPRGNASNCTFSRTTFADGRIDVAGRCTSSDDEPLEVALTGTFTPAEIDAAISANAGNRTMLLRGRMHARRTGDCQAAPS